MYAILKGTLDYLGRKGGSVDPMTREAYEYFSALLKKGETDEREGNGKAGL